MRIIRFCVALFMLACAALPAAAQEKYPDHPVKFVVSFAAGGSNDIIARVLCDWLSEHFGQQFVVENRPGGSGNIGAASVMKTIGKPRAAPKKNPKLMMKRSSLRPTS